jgi:hypothetical protein
MLLGQAFAATARDWHEGTLLETEQQKVPSGTTYNSSTDGTVKPKGDKTTYSQNTTTTATQDYDTFQLYTIQGASGKIYTASERLLFPWSKPANITVGEKVKYVVEKNKLYLLDDDGKEHKASIKKVKVQNAE